MIKVIVQGLEELYVNGSKVDSAYDTAEVFIANCEDPHEAAIKMLEGSIYNNLTLVNR